MFKKIVSMMLAVSVFATPCVAMAASHHHHHDSRPKYRREYRPRYHRHHYSRSMHRGDYIAVAAGVIIGAILANK